jgi:TNF receptor-associated factor 1
MRLRLYLNGDADVRGTHLSVFLVVMRGEFDGILPWPFAFKVHFRLINQSTPNDNRTHVHRAFWPDLPSPSFQRPHLAMNEAYGFQQFVPLCQLSDRPGVFIDDDTLFISAAIDFHARRPGKACNQAVGNFHPFS